MEITITEEDARFGKPCDTWECPLARALWRETGVKWAVKHWIARPLGVMSVWLNLNPDAEAWVREFDSSKGSKFVAPFKVTFDDKRMADCLEAARAIPVPA